MASDEEGARSWGWNGKKGVMGMIWFDRRVGRVEKWWEKEKIENKSAYSFLFYLTPK